VVVVEKVVAGNVNWQMVCAITFPRQIVVFDMIFLCRMIELYLKSKKSHPF
jgi:hypothetical protein